MQRLMALNSRDVKGILEKIKTQWAAEPKLDKVFMLSSKNKIYVVNKDVFELDLDKLRINSFGMYFGEIMRDGVRLSIEGSQLIGPFAKKNVVELDEKAGRDWLRGIDIDYESDDNPFVLIKSGNDFMGCGKCSNGKILNYVPKIRRLRSSD